MVSPKSLFYQLSREQVKTDEKILICDVLFVDQNWWAYHLK